MRASELDVFTPVVSFDMSTVAELHAALEAGVKLDLGKEPEPTSEFSVPSRLDAGLVRVAIQDYIYSEPIVVRRLAGWGGFGASR